jgi:hypothetical protein
MDRLGVRLEKIRNLVSPEHPISNKIDCLNVETACDRICFLDSDIMMMRDIELADEVDGRIVAVPPRWQLVERSDWLDLFSNYGLPLPQPRRNPTSGLVVDVPYINSGVVSVASDCTAALAEAWTEVTIKLRETSGLNPRARKHINQYAFPVATALIGEDIRFASIDWNFPSWVRKLDRENLPIFYHYQKPYRLLRESWVAYRVKSLVDGHPDIRRAVLQHPPFAKVLSPTLRLLSKVKEHTPSALRKGIRSLRAARSPARQKRRTQ